MPTAIRRLRDGLPVFRLGGSVRAFVSDIDRWLHTERIRRVEEKTELETAGVVVSAANLLGTVAALLRTNPARRYAVIPLGVDVLEFDHAQKQLRSAEEKFNRLVDAVPVWIWETDDNNIFRYSNAAVFEILGYRPPEIVGFSPADFLVAEPDLTQYRQVIDALTRQRRLVRGFPCRYKRRDGGVRRLDTDMEPVFDAGGKFVAIRGVSRDVTEGSRAEETILRGAQEWRRTFDAVPDPVFMTDEDNTVFRANRAAAAFFGKNYEAVIGEKCYRLVHGADAPPPYCPSKKVFRSGKITRFEFYEPKRSKIFYVELTPVKDDRGKTVSCILAFRDVTGQKRAEEALRRFFAVTDESLALLTSDGRIVSATPAFAGALGYEEADLAGVRLDDLTTAEGCESLRAEAQRTPDAEPRAVEATFLTKYGPPVALRASVTAFDDPGGDFSWIVVKTET